jgi:hypothetical protein
MTPLETILSNTVILGALGFLLKVWIEKRLSYDLNIQLEKFRAELAKSIAKNSIQENWNHSKRMEIFADLYSHMVDADFEIKTFLMNLKVENQDGIEERSRKLCEKYLEMNALIHKNELFLEDEVITAIHNAYSPFFEYAQHYVDSANKEEVSHIELPNDMDSIMKIGEYPRKMVLKVFKKLSGLNE